MIPGGWAGSNPTGFEQIALPKDREFVEGNISRVHAYRRADKLYHEKSSVNSHGVGSMEHEVSSLCSFFPLKYSVLSLELFPRCETQVVDMKNPL